MTPMFDRKESQNFGEDFFNLADQ